MGEPEVELRRLGGGEYAGRIHSRVEASAAQAWERLSRLDELDSLIPFCEHSESRLMGDDIYELTIRVGLPWPFPQVRYVARSELDHAAREVRWRLLSGTLKRNDGALRFVELGEGACRAEYSCIVGVGFHVPRLGERVIERWVLPRVMSGVISKLAEPPQQA